MMGLFLFCSDFTAEISVETLSMTAEFRADASVAELNVVASDNSNISDPIFRRMTGASVCNKVLSSLIN